MTLLLVMVAQLFSGDEARQNFNHEEFPFLVHCLPRAGFVEKKIEEGWKFFFWDSLSVPGSSRHRSQVEQCG